MEDVNCSTKPTGLIIVGAHTVVVAVAQPGAIAVHQSPTLIDFPDGLDVRGGIIALQGNSGQMQMTQVAGALDAIELQHQRRVAGRTVRRTCVELRAVELQLQRCFGQQWRTDQHQRQSCEMKHVVLLVDCGFIRVCS